MWNGKKKAVTFSFDDGVLQDLRVLEIMNKYGVKGTFNLNSGHFGNRGIIGTNGAKRDVVLASKVKETYEGHEVAVHTLTHPNLRVLDDETIERQVMIDRELLSNLVGYDVIGMAYPFGLLSADGREVRVLSTRTPIRYARTVVQSFNFDIPENLLAYNPTAHWANERGDELIDEFLASDSDKPQALYLWGHTYELDWADDKFPGHMTEAKFEAMCKRLVEHKDEIFFGTNREVLLQEK